METGLWLSAWHVPRPVGAALPGLLRRGGPRHHHGRRLLRRGRHANSRIWARARRSSASWSKRRNGWSVPPPSERWSSPGSTLRAERVLEEAAARGATPRQLACTFLGPLVGDGWAAFVQIGDGAIVFDGEAGYKLAFWPDNGEYANTTRFLTDPDYREHLRIEVFERSISDLAVLTDGLQMLALDFATAGVHDRFFSPLFRTVRDGPDEETLRASLLEFMDSKRVNDRTDDDKTLLLATRSAPDVPSSIPDATA